jgi:hypothetical protein
MPGRPWCPLAISRHKWRWTRVAVPAVALVIMGANYRRMKWGTQQAGTGSTSPPRTPGGFAQNVPLMPIPTPSGATAGMTATLGAGAGLIRER